MSAAMTTSCLQAGTAGTASRLVVVADAALGSCPTVRLVLGSPAPTRLRRAATRRSVRPATWGARRQGLVGLPQARYVGPDPLPQDQGEVRKLRDGLESLRRELDDARAKAGLARNRHGQVAARLEELQQLAMGALRRRDDEAARRALEDKRSAAEDLAKAGQRADVLEALCDKLAQAIADKEAQIAKLSPGGFPRPSSMSGGADRPLVPPPAPAPGVSQSPLSEEELRRRFLDMERQDLERMLNRSPAAPSRRDSDSGFGGSAGGALGAGGDDGGAVIDDARMEYGEGPRRQGPQSADPYQERRASAPPEAPAAAKPPVGVAGIDTEIERLEGREAVLAARGTAGAADLAAARSLLARLRELRTRALDEDARSGGASRRSATEALSPDAKQAVVFLREGDADRAAVCLYRLLKRGGSAVAIWDDAAAGSGGRLSVAEASDVYAAFIRLYIIPEVLAQSPAASAWSQYSFSSSSSGDDGRQLLDRLQRFLGMSDSMAAAVHGRVYRSVAMERALAADPGETARTLQALAAVLGLSQSQRPEIPGQAEAAGKYKRLVAAALHEVTSSLGAGGGRSGSSEAPWAIQDRQLQELEQGLAQLGLDAAAAQSATVAAGRELCDELLHSALEAYRRGTGSFKGGAAAIELQNVVRLVEHAVLPAYRLASRQRPPQSERDKYSSSFMPSSLGFYPDIASGSRTPAAAQAPSSPEEAQQLAGLLRTQLVSGKDAEDLYRAFCERELGLRAMNAASAVAQGQSARWNTAEEMVPLRGAAVLEGVLGLPSSVALSTATRVAVAGYASALSAALEDSRITNEERSALAAQRRALGLSEEEGARVEDAVAAQKIGTVSRKLLDKRNRGGDISAADIRDLVALCTNLRASQVTSLDAREKLLLFRRAVQAALEPAPDKSSAPPSYTALDGLQMLGVLRRALALPQADADSTLTSVTEAVAASLLTQAQASLQRGQLELAADDMGRLAVALALHPSPTARGLGSSGRMREARDLYLLYSNRRARWERDMRQPVDVRQRDVEEEMLRRLQYFLGI
eukprot:SM000077S21589  [mRNA]  locus=s77:395067:401139:+ [translate_table: standard]